MENPYFVRFQIFAYSLSALWFMHAFKKGTNIVISFWLEFYQ